MKSFFFVLCSSIAISGLPVSPSLQTANTASVFDKAFVGKVSQGGMYEVEASKLAEQKATTQDVRDMAIMEIHDHNLVNDGLKEIAISSGVDVAPHLNETFQRRLTALNSVSGPAFNAAYVTDMAQIHDMDEKLFAKEAVEGSGDFKSFAASTDMIVKRHIGAIHGTDQK